MPAVGRKWVWHSAQSRVILKTGESTLVKFVPSDLYRTFDGAWLFRDLCTRGYEMFSGDEVYCGSATAENENVDDDCKCGTGWHAAHRQHTTGNNGFSYDGDHNVVKHFVNPSRDVDSSTVSEPLR